ncbi:MAG TPA: hypothetical protein VFR63_04865 [Gaiellaceae bacterium]|nr:hypothetical protein [Gaiellaceae bacterium]
MATPLQGTSQERKADRWIAFAGLMLILAGTLDIFDGLRAIGAQDTSFDALFYDNNLEAWGWFYLILGIVLVAAGFAVFARVRWAVVLGIAVTLIAATLNFFWIFVYPLAAAVIVTLNVLVAYALTMYGLEEDPGARG